MTSLFMAAAIRAQAEQRVIDACDDMTDGATDAQREELRSALEALEALDSVANPNHYFDSAAGDWVCSVCGLCTDHCDCQNSRVDAFDRWWDSREGGAK